MGKEEMLRLRGDHPAMQLYNSLKTEQLSFSAILKWDYAAVALTVNAIFPLGLDPFSLFNTHKSFRLKLL